MAKDKTTLPSASVTSLIGAKTVSTVNAYQHGVVTVLEFKFSDTTSQFVKFASNGGLEIGGTAEMGTGTVVRF
jgi:hypothetical protein